MSDILMKGTEPIGQVSDITADNVEYSSGVSVKDKIDEFEFTGFNGGASGVLTDTNAVTVTATKNCYLNIATISDDANGEVSIALESAFINLLCRLYSKNGAYQFMTIFLPKGATVYVKANIANIGAYGVTNFN